jgi:site-specific recombinase XerD
MESFHDITLYNLLLSTYSDIGTAKRKITSTYLAGITGKMENKRKFTPNPELKLMDQVRETLRYYHYAYRTEQTYCQWISRYIYFFNKKKHLKDLGAKDVERFLSHLATDENVSASTQKQALNALVFLYRDVLDQSLGDSIAPVRAKRKRRPPTVLTQGEAQRLLKVMNGTHALMAKLIYGTGMRLMECVRLRIQDVDFGQGHADVKTTEIYTHVMRRDIDAVRSPLDLLQTS